MADKDLDDELADDPDLSGPLDDPDLEELPDDAVIDEDVIDEDPDLDDDLDEDPVVDVDLDEDAVSPVVAPTGDEDEDEDEDEAEADEDDVEASLDVILKEKLVVADEEEDDEAPDQEERAEPAVKVLPKRPDEFVCQSCFLVKHPSQLADAKRMFCRDCV